MKVDARRAAQQRRIAAALGQIGFALPGSLTVKAYRCGKANCRCKSEPPQLHGPYAFWTRKVDAKTATRMLSAEEVAQYQQLFDNARKLRALVAQLQELSLQLVESQGNGRSGPRATTTPSSPSARPRRSRTSKAQRR